jgi:hypothetical protein
LKDYIKSSVEEIEKMNLKEQNIEFTPNQEIKINSPGSADFEPNKNLSEEEKKYEEILNNFIKLLDQEIKKIYIFFMNKERELYISINSHLHIRQTYENFDLKSIAREFIELNKISSVTLNITKFIDLNMTAIKTILKKFDDKFSDFYGRISIKYIQKKLESKNSDLLYILQFKIIDEASALLEDLMNDLKSKFSNKQGSTTKPELKIHKNSIDNLDRDKLIGLLKIEVEEEPGLDDNSLYVIINENSFNLENNLKLIDDNNQTFRNNFKEWSNFLKLNAKTYNNIFSVTKTTSLDGVSVQDRNNLGYDTVEIIKSKKLRKKSTSGAGDAISKENKTNIYLILVHTFFFMLSNSIIIPSNIYYLQKLDYKTMFSGLVLACSPLGTLGSLFYTNKWIETSYRLPFILSALEITLGHTVYFLSLYFESIIPMFIGRLVLGLGSNRVANRSYLIAFVPKNQINKFLLYFQLCSLIGLASGPLLYIALNTMNNFVKEDNVFLNEYNYGAILCSFSGLIFTVIVALWFSEPLQSNFNIFQADPLFSLRSGSSSSIDPISKKDKQMIEEIDDKLSEFNERSQYSDTNLVAKSIEQIAWREKKTISYIYKCFLVFVFILIVCRLTTESLLVITPFYLHDISSDMINEYISLLISFALFLVVPVGFLVNNYLAYKIVDRRMLIYLLIFTIIFNFFIIDIFYTSMVQYCIIFMCLIISCNVLENIATTMFSKIIPADYELWNYNAGFLIQVGTTLGRILGAAMLTMAGFTSDQDLNRITYGITLGMFMISLVVIVFYYTHLRVKAIARILRGRSLRKLRKTEF